MKPTSKYVLAEKTKELVDVIKYLADPYPRPGFTSRDPGLTTQSPVSSSGVSCSNCQALCHPVLQYSPQARGLFTFCSKRCFDVWYDDYEQSYKAADRIVYRGKKAVPATYPTVTGFILEQKFGIEPPEQREPEKVEERETAQGEVNPEDPQREMEIQRQEQYMRLLTLARAGLVPPSQLLRGMLK